MNRTLRLTVLLAVAAIVSAPAAAAPDAAGCRPTAQDGFGPFGRGEPPRRAKIGTGHVLIGVVLSSTDCRPIPRARVNLWQSNRDGVYTTAGSATVITDRAGRFRFEGPFPSQYEGLPPHIHIRVFAPLHQPLLTRFVPRLGERIGRVRLVVAPEDV